jgi:hypothetical protein
MNSMRALAILLLAFTLAANAQEKRTTGNNRTDPKGQEKSTGNSNDRGSDRTPQSQPPKEVPQTKPVGVTYPPVLPQPAPPPPLYPGPLPPQTPPPVVDAEPPVEPTSAPQRKLIQAELDDCVENPQKAGYDFEGGNVVSCEDSTVDIYFSHAPNDTTYFLVPQDTDIKDIGKRNSLSEVRGFRPRNWSPNHAVPIVAEHVYVVWTYQDDFYLVRVRDVRQDHVAFDWVWHSQLSRKVVAAAEKKAREKKEREAERKALGPIFGK